MAAVISGNTEAGFVHASLVEFIHLWGSGKDTSIRINCKDGQATFSMKCKLGNLGDQHMQVPVTIKSSKKKSKSASRKSCNNARVSCLQAAAVPPPVPPPTTRSVSSPVTQARTVISLASSHPPAQPMLLLPKKVCYNLKCFIFTPL